MKGNTTTGFPPEKIRVLSLQCGARLGGTELMNFSILQRVDRMRFEVVVCFLDEEGPVSGYYRQDGFEPLHLNYNRRPLLAVAWDLFWLLKWHAPDIVHISGLRANILGRVASRLARCQNIVASQHSIDAWRKWHTWLDRITSRWVSIYISNTFAAAERLQKEERIPLDKLFVIQNGLDATPFEDVIRGRVRRELGTRAGDLVVTCVGHLRSAKGYHILLEAVDTLRRQGISFHLWLVGDGDLRTSMEAKAKSLDLWQDIRFLGTRTDIPDILADSDIFALASLWEGMPGAIMEAMAARLPVVTTRVGGIPELVVDGETGLLVPPGDPQALASALARLISDEELRHHMGDAGHCRILTHFGLAEKVRELEEVYAQLWERSLIDRLGC